jgi:hypothetical protein
LRVRNLLLIADGRILNDDEQEILIRCHHDLVLLAANTKERQIILETQRGAGGTNGDITSVVESHRLHAPPRSLFVALASSVLAVLLSLYRVCVDLWVQVSYDGSCLRGELRNIRRVLVRQLIIHTLRRTNRNTISVH